MVVSAMLPTAIMGWSRRSTWRPALVMVLGAGGVALCAQLSLSVPLSPVPVTGQTFGAMLLGLLLGARLAGGALLLYVGAAAAGLPVLAQGASGAALLGPSGGYVAGMVGAAVVIGACAQRGWTRGVLQGAVVCLVASAAIFALGLANLARFVEAHELLAAGLWPFLPGNLIKSVAAAVAAVGLERAVAPP